MIYHSQPQRLLGLSTIALLYIFLTCGVNSESTPIERRHRVERQLDDLWEAPNDEDDRGYHPDIFSYPSSYPGDAALSAVSSEWPVPPTLTIDSRHLLPILNHILTGSLYPAADRSRVDNQSVPGGGSGKMIEKRGGRKRYYGQPTTGKECRLDGGDIVQLLQRMLRARSSGDTSAKVNLCGKPTLVGHLRTNFRFVRR